MPAPDLEVVLRYSLNLGASYTPLWVREGDQGHFEDAFRVVRQSPSSLKVGFRTTLIYKYVFFLFTRFDNQCCWFFLKAFNGCFEPPGKQCFGGRNSTPAGTPRLDSPPEGFSPELLLLYYLFVCFV